MDWRAIGEMTKIDRERGVLIALHQECEVGRRLGVASHELLDTEDLVEPRLPVRHGSRPGLHLDPWFCVTRRTRRAVGPGLLPELLSPLHRPHAGVNQRVEIIALLVRSWTFPWVVEGPCEFGRLFQCLEECNNVADLAVVEEAMSAPWRHDRFRIVYTWVVDIVEQPFVVPSGNADFRKVGTDISRQVSISCGPHDMAGET